MAELSNQITAEEWEDLRKRLAQFGKKRAMPWTRADKLKLAADIAAEVEREEVE